jgi:hypothetical protein
MKRPALGSGWLFWQLTHRICPYFILSVFGDDLVELAVMPLHCTTARSYESGSPQRPERMLSWPPSLLKLQSRFLVLDLCQGVQVAKVPVVVLRDACFLSSLWSIRDQFLRSYSTAYPLVLKYGCSVSQTAHNSTRLVDYTASQPDQTQHLCLVQCKNVSTNQG